MSLKLTFLGHSACLLEEGDHAVVVDPFLSGNELASHTPDQITCGTVALTHGHADHFGDTLEIARRNDATVIAAFEICNYCSEQGHSKVEPGNPGGKIDTPFGFVALTQAFHSSSYEGRYMGMPCGMVFHFRESGKTVYHAGDTGLFSDMKLIGELYRPDLALLPVGDRFTMGPELASKAADWIGAPRVVPIHYATFPLLLSDISGFKPDKAKVKALEPGEAVTL